MRRQWTPAGVLWIAIDVGLLTAAVWYRPLARIGFADFDARHGTWANIDAVGLLLGLAKTVYRHFFRREQTRAEMAALRDDIRSGRLKRMSLAARCGALLFALALVV